MLHLWTKKCYKRNKSYLRGFTFLLVSGFTLLFIAGLAFVLVDCLIPSFIAGGAFRLVSSRTLLLIFRFIPGFALFFIRRLALILILSFITCLGGVQKIALEGLLVKSWMSIKMTSLSSAELLFYLPNCARRGEKGWDESKGSHFPFSSLISTSESD